MAETEKPDGSKATLQNSGVFERFGKSTLAPILITALTGFLATQVNNYFQHKQTIDLEHERLKTALIQKAIDTDDSRIAARTLLFYLKMGLIDDPQGKIKSFEKNPEDAPSKKIIVPDDANSKETFFECYGKSDAGLKNTKIDNLNKIFEYFSRDRTISDVRVVAYVLATIEFETARSFAPLAEFGDDTYFEKLYGKDSNRGSQLGNVEIGDGSKFRGRGYMQLTGRANYSRIGKSIGIDLVSQPELLLNPEVSFQVMTNMLLNGEATGKRLSNFINENETNYRDARRTVNGIDHADEIAAKAVVFENCLKQSIESKGN